jgi:hypothetical protein
MVKSGTTDGAGRFEGHSEVALHDYSGEDHALLVEPQGREALRPAEERASASFARHPG